jgi:hypothetical protein
MGIALFQAQRFRWINAGIHADQEGGSPPRWRRQGAFGETGSVATISRQEFSYHGHNRSSPHNPIECINIAIMT